MIGGTRSAAICLRNRCGLSGSHCQWAPTPVQMLVSLCELIEPLRVVAGQLPASSVPCLRPRLCRRALRRFPSVLQYARARRRRREENYSGSYLTRLRNCA